VKGFGSTYIGAGTKDPDTFALVQRLFLAMTQLDLSNLERKPLSINLAYHVVHCFRPTPERILALPALLDVAASPNLLKRLVQLWYEDSVLSKEAGAFRAHAEYLEQRLRGYSTVSAIVATLTTGAVRRLRRVLKPAP